MTVFAQCPTRRVNIFRVYTYQTFYLSPVLSMGGYPTNSQPPLAHSWHPSRLCSYILIRNSNRDSDTILDMKLLKKLINVGLGTDMSRAFSSVFFLRILHTKAASLDLNLIIRKTLDTGPSLDLWSFLFPSIPTLFPIFKYFPFFTMFSLVKLKNLAYRGCWTNDRNGRNPSNENLSEIQLWSEDLTNLIYRFSDYNNNNNNYQRKKGSQQARNADMIMPRVLAAFRSLFILLLLVIGGSSGCGSGGDWSIVGRDVNPADMPFIWRCLLSRAAATLLLKC